MNELLEKIYAIHDIDCNQKYDKILPYSFHLKAVVAQADKYHLYIPNIYTDPYARSFAIDINKSTVIIASAGHDLIEDARMTFNDVLDLVSNKEIADIIYACTEEKGKNREERHSQKFFDELKQNRLAVYVKLCDIMANVLYSLLSNSSMFKKYQKEFSNLKEQLYIEEEYEPLWKDLEKLLC